jgi:hypothetical protein
MPSYARPTYPWLAKIEAWRVREVSRKLDSELDYGTYRPSHSVSEIFIPFSVRSVKPDSNVETNKWVPNYCTAVQFASPAIYNSLKDG